METVIDQHPTLLSFADNKLAIKPSA
jgi:hypothetical protein